MVIIRTTYEKQKGYYDVDISDPFTPCDHSENSAIRRTGQFN
jgi:hypothetical protein